MVNQLFDAAIRRGTPRCFGRPCRSVRRHAMSTILLGLSLVALAGCSSKTYLMPTPNVYTNPGWNPFADVPPPRQGDQGSGVFGTDRVPEKQTPDQWEYGY